MHTKRNFYTATHKKHQVWLIAFFLMLVFGNQALSQEGNDKNVVLIMVDDLNDWVAGYDGYPGSKTPNIQRLADISTVFTNAWPNVPWCNPSRVSMLTGIHPLNSGVTSLSEFPFRRFLPNAETIVERFDRDGYHTKGMGKIFHRDDNLAEVWDEYDALHGKPTTTNRPGHEVQSLIDFRGPTADWGGVNAKREDWGDYHITTEAVQFLQGEQAQKEPFFLAMGYRLPHLPWFYPEEFDDFLANIDLPLPNDDTIGESTTFMHNLIKNNGIWSDGVKSYLASIHFIDYNIGIVLDALEQQELLESTIIVLVSDHGFHLGEKGRWEKTTVWNESLVTPLMIYDPSLEDAPPSIDLPVSLLDIYPTILELCNMDGNQFIDGKSLVNLLSNEEVATTDYVNFAFTPKGSFAFADRTHKFVRLKDGFEAIFDLTEDPDELSPLQDVALSADFRQRMDSVINAYTLYDPVASVQNVLFTNSDTSNIVSWDPLPGRTSYEIQLVRDTTNIDATSTSYRTEAPGIELPLISVPKFIRARGYNPQHSGEWSSFYSLPVITTTISQQDSLKVFPNPTSTYFEVRANRPLDCMYYEITSLSGNPIKAGLLRSGGRVDISDLPTGVYLFVLPLKDGDSYVTKIIKD